jgi:ferrous iron transport protein B
MLFILYGFGMILAVLSALLLRKVFFKTAEIPFVMELPPYRVPTGRSILKHVWFRTELYLKKIGGVILIASVIIWIMSNFPRRLPAGFEQKISRIEKSHIPDKQKIETIEKLRKEQKSQQQRNSILGRLGRTIEPVMKPLGFDWRLSVSLLSGVAAKEVVVSTLGVLFQAGNHEGHSSLVENIQAQTADSGNRLFTPLNAFSFMLFILTYFPCIGVVSAISRESGSWKWAAFIILYTTGVAWLLSFTVYQLGSMLA